MTLSRRRQTRASRRRSKKGKRHRRSRGSRRNKYRGSYITRYHQFPNTFDTIEELSGENTFLSQHENYTYNVVDMGDYKEYRTKTNLIRSSSENAKEIFRNSGCEFASTVWEKVVGSTIKHYPFVNMFEGPQNRRIVDWLEPWVVGQDLLINDFLDEHPEIVMSNKPTYIDVQPMLDTNLFEILENRDFKRCRKIIVKKESNKLTLTQLHEAVYVNKAFSELLAEGNSAAVLYKQHEDVYMGELIYNMLTLRTATEVPIHLFSNASERYVDTLRQHGELPHFMATSYNWVGLQNGLFDQYTYDVIPRGDIPAEPNKCCTLLVTLLPFVQFIAVPSYVGDSEYECEVIICPKQAYTISAAKVVDGYTYYSVIVYPPGVSPTDIE